MGRFEQEKLLTFELPVCGYVQCVEVQETVTMSTRMRVMKILGEIIIVAIITVQYCQARQGDDREDLSSDKVAKVRLKE